MDQHNLLESTMPVSQKYESSGHAVAIALGSNMGDRYAYIEKALRELERHEDVISISRTSFMYESKPMYVEDQNQFLNCAIMAETTLEPLDLLAFLKHVEGVVGRVESYRYGPRAIDLDIIFYDSITFTKMKHREDGSKYEELAIPHIRADEREFVLRPLQDIIPNYIHPTRKMTIRDILSQLLGEYPYTVDNKPPLPSTLHKVLPFPSPAHHPHILSTLWPLSPRTYLMATINATPDSFSSTAPSTTASAVSQALAAAADGADIIDVGGYSTRPGATPVSPADELSRVIPVVRALREQGVVLPISVDTFRPAVLRAAVEAGANCLNDVTALAGETDDGEAGSWEMARVVKELGVPVVMMHSRGAHRASENKDYGEQGVLKGVQEELGRHVEYALRCGIRRWNMLVDPGFGFSKTTEGNLELLSRFREITGPGAGPSVLRDFPTLAGLSRKSFLGHVVGRKTEPQDRNWATAAAVSAAVQQGVDVVRVHWVAEMRDVVRVADAVYRRIRR